MKARAALAARPCQWCRRRSYSRAVRRAALGEARSPCTCELTCGGLEGHLVDQAPSGPWMSPGCSPADSDQLELPSPSRSIVASTSGHQPWHIVVFLTGFGRLAQRLPNRFIKGCLRPRLSRWGALTKKMKLSRPCSPVAVSVAAPCELLRAGVADSVKIAASCMRHCEWSVLSMNEDRF